MMPAPTSTTSAFAASGSNTTGLLDSFVLAFAIALWRISGYPAAVGLGVGPPGRLR